MGSNKKEDEKMAKTSADLMMMFTSGSESNIRYQVFAEVADKEGKPNTAKIFRAIATSKMFHALSHFRATNFADSTAENLNLAFEEETYDYKNAYPSMVQDAVEDDALGARHSLEYGMSIGPVITKLNQQSHEQPRNR